MISWVLLLFSFPLFAASPDATFYVREMKSPQDVSAINENFRSIADYARQLSASVDEGTDLSGLASLTSTQTFTAGNTFTGAVTLSSVTLSGYSNVWNMVSIIDAFGVKAATFTLSDYVTSTSSISWRVDYDCSNGQATAPYFVWVFNGDKTQKYGGQSYYGSGTNTSVLFNNGYAFGIHGAVTPIKVFGNIYFQTAPGGGGISVYGDGFVQNNDNQPTKIWYGALYTGSESPTSISVIGSSVNEGTLPNFSRLINCHLELWRKGFSK